MIAIDNVVLSDDVRDRHFICDLNKCKGACCVEGDSGAPVEPEEMALMEAEFDKIKPYLRPGSAARLERNGLFELDPEDGRMKTALAEDGACAFAVESDGVWLCGIEQAHEKGDSVFQKPVSCHLYPLRITSNEGYDAVNYETWDICDPACQLGAVQGMPLYRFVKAALIRKYGEEFYATLEATIAYMDDEDRAKESSS